MFLNSIQVGVWVVGKSDFKENPRFDLDLDLGFVKNSDKNLLLNNNVNTLILIQILKQTLEDIVLFSSKG